MLTLEQPCCLKANASMRIRLGGFLVETAASVEVRTSLPRDEGNRPCFGLTSPSGLSIPRASGDSESGNSSTDAES